MRYLTSIFLQRFSEASLAQVTAWHGGSLTHWGHLCGMGFGAAKIGSTDRIRGRGAIRPYTLVYEVPVGWAQ